MTAQLSGWIKKQPLLAFYLLALLITWLGWIPQVAYSRGLFPFDNVLFYIIGGAGPLLAVFIVQSVLCGKASADVIFSPFLQWRVGAVWYLVALVGYPALWLVSLFWTGELQTEVAKLAPYLSLLPTFLIAFLAAVPEEAAWRGFALPRLQSRYSALVSSLLITIMGAVWHLPLLLNKDNVMSTYPILPFFLFVAGMTFIYTWIFNNTRGSLLLVTLFHAVSNTAGTFGGLEQGVVFALAAMLLVILFGHAHLSRHSTRPSHTNGLESSNPAASSLGQQGA